MYSTDGKEINRPIDLQILKKKTIYNTISFKVKSNTRRSSWYHAMSFWISASCLHITFVNVSGGLHLCLCLYSQLQRSPLLYFILASTRRYPSTFVRAPLALHIANTNSLNIFGVGGGWIDSHYVNYFMLGIYTMSALCWRARSRFLGKEGRNLSKVPLRVCANAQN